MSEEKKAEITIQNKTEKKTIETRNDYSLPSSKVKVPMPPVKPAKDSSPSNTSKSTAKEE